MVAAGLLEKNYDEEIDILRLSYAGDYDYDCSLELMDNLIVDFDTEGIPRAFEFLEVSKLFNVSENYLRNIEKIDLVMMVNSKAIKIHVKCWSDS